MRASAYKWNTLGQQVMIIANQKLPAAILAHNSKIFMHLAVLCTVLNEPLQMAKSQSKWMSRAQLGIYLGMSPRYARTVALVLNPRTGLVLAQWPFKFDNSWLCHMMTHTDTGRSLQGFR